MNLVEDRIIYHGDHSSVTEFILSGLTEHPELQLPLLLLFLGIYVVTVVGNLGMIMLIVFSSHLHTPMYYFLSSLSLIDLCQSTVITPKMLVKFVTENSIFYTERITQLYFFIVFVIAECHMLAAMVYGSYVATCNPFFYNVIMSYHSSLTVGINILGIIGSTIHIGFMLELFFCKTNVVNHYFCDLFPLLEIYVSSICINELLVLSLSKFNILTPALTILAFYIFIISSFLQ
ncbi:putative olfactory receptor 8G2 [Elephas maximus indicus]|uniref:putative olfactory receptor 8G2 n=1 Tax=Elephas maximus indicus TaxID=99487 RepID=UPI0021165B11|nr:putative olfactory receptor 8G2 [Elephas maximus indicus]